MAPYYFRFPLFGLSGVGGGGNAFFLLHSYTKSSPGKLRNLSGTGDRHQLLKRFLLWVFFCKLPGYVVHRPQCKHVRRG